MVSSLQASEGLGGFPVSLRKRPDLPRAGTGPARLLPACTGARRLVGRQQDVSADCIPDCQGQKAPSASHMPGPRRSGQTFTLSDAKAFVLDHSHKNKKKDREVMLCKPLALPILGNLCKTMEGLRYVTK